MGIALGVPKATSPRYPSLMFAFNTRSVPPVSGFIESVAVENVALFSAASVMVTDGSNETVVPRRVNIALLSEPGG